jgi:oligosaccharyltransferase complex subunit beta
MRWLFSFLLLGLLSVVQAASSSGNKLLVVLEELAEKSKYSKYLADLEGKGSVFGLFYIGYLGMQD